MLAHTLLASQCRWTLGYPGAICLCPTRTWDYHHAINSERPVPTIRPMFPVPFAFDQHTSPDRMNKSLRTLFLARETQGAKFENPDPYTERNSPVYESRFDLFSWPEPEVAELREFCMSRLMQVVKELNGYAPDDMRRLQVSVDAWFHITRRHGYFGVHNHPNASWSGVYCVDAGVTDPGGQSGGRLTFLHPNPMMAMYADPANDGLRPPFNAGHIWYALQPGQLVLFPSWLMHHVTPFEGGGERITVAFNCTFAFPQA